MVGPCREESRFSWHIAHSWVNVRGFCTEDAEAALDGDDELTVVFDIIQAQLADSDSMVSQMLKMAPETGRRIKIFLHPYHNLHGPAAQLLVAPFYTGIHIFYSDDNIVGDGVDLSATQSLLGLRVFVHELWHTINFLNDPPLDIRDLFRMATERSNGAWTNPDYRESAFEEAFATVLGYLAMGGEGHYPGRGDYICRVTDDGWTEARRIELSFGGDVSVSDTVIDSLDCLFPMALRHPMAWRAMAITVIRHGGRMDLETFLRHFSEDYPRAALRIIPEYCRP